MLKFISSKEAAEKWCISEKKVIKLCSDGKINGAITVGNMWKIPSTAENPAEQLSVSPTATGALPSPKPFVKWVGGKTQLLPEIEKLIPCLGGSCPKKYVEPMVGGGALLFDIISNPNYAFEEFYIIDVNAELINAYSVIKNDVESLIKKLTDMQLSFLPMDENGRKYHYYSAREKFNSLKLSEETATEKAALFIFLNKTCFNGLYRVNKRGQFNVPMGSYKNPTICDENNLRSISEALKRVHIICGDYTLSAKFIDSDTFVYIDPPYRPISVTSGFTSYNSDAFGDAEQISLADFINGISATGATVVLSNSDPKNVNENDNFFDDLYGDYSIHRVSAPRMINSKSDMRGKITELLICNKKTFY